MGGHMVRTALVTGGTTGIGAAISTRLANDGMNVFVVKSPSMTSTEADMMFRERGGGTCIHVAAHDLSLAAGCISAVAECITRFGSLNVLINNAAISGAQAVGPVNDCNDSHIDNIIDTNLKAPLRLAREAFPYLKDQGGVIVNISSTAEIQAQAKGLAYVASKAGLGGLTRALGYDLAAHGVRVVCVAPGDVATTTSRDPILLRDCDDVDISWRKPTPLGFSAEPEDVANAVAWLISDQARYVTATTILVDGGRTAY